MKQKIEFEIDVPDGKKAVWKDGKLVLEDIEPQLPKTWEEFCKQNAATGDEYFIDGSCHITRCVYGERNTIIDRNMLPSKQAAEQHIALMQLHQLRDCYRQGWKPYYLELNGSKKWCIIKCNDKLSVDVHYNRNEFLSFPTQELAEQFLNNFKDLIKQAGDLI